jgi:uncharacterized protein YegL
MKTSRLALEEYTLPDARPLPVFLLLDASGSMAENGKIEALNGAVADMLTSFTKEENLRTALNLGVIAFGGTVRTHLNFMPVAKAAAAWRPLKAGGGTPMGELFRSFLPVLEDRSVIPSRSYRPTLILVSDGQATDEWEPPLRAMFDSTRASKAIRLAMGIGADADSSMLARFVNNPAISVFSAANAREIAKFFRWATMSVVARTRSTTPDKVTPVPIDDDDSIRY